MRSDTIDDYKRKTVNVKPKEIQNTKEKKPLANVCLKNLSLCPKMIRPIHEVDGAIRFLRAFCMLSVLAEAAQLKLDLLYSVNY